MNIKTVLCLFYFVLIGITAYGNDVQIYQEDSTLTSEEIAIFERIKKDNPNFDYSKEVKRYYKIAKKSKEKKLFLTEMAAGPSSKEISKIYFEPNSRVITYEANLGSLYHGEGAMLIGDKIIIDSGKGCGQLECSILVSSGKKKIFEQFVKITILVLKFGGYR